VHSRIYYFRNDLAHDVYLASADWMDRNFFRRIEVSFPVLDRKLKKRVLDEGMKIYLQDNQQAWDMDGEGHYKLKSAPRSKPICAQQELLKLLAQGNDNETTT
jgi:polyphosphate kinase